MKNNIVFVSAYPNDATVKDGMQQRIVNVDSLAKEANKVYLDISFKRNLIKEKVRIDEKTLLVRLNFFIHFYFICKSLTNCNIVYVHSLYNYIKILPFIGFAKRGKVIKKIFFDFHGVVPEEMAFMGMPCKGKIYDLLEKFCISSATTVILVTKAMQEYVENKYKSIKFDSLVYPIYPNNVFKEADPSKIEQLKTKLNIADDSVLFLYSGNAQKWQNIDLMMELIKKYSEVENFIFVILTGDLDAFESKLKEFGLDGCKNIFLNSVMPQELNSYYALANYGFLLRDEHILNRVANPTKIVEYLYYGMMPIVKYEWIGDYKELGYDYVKYSDDLSCLTSRRSNANAKLIQKMRASTESEAKLLDDFNG
jgi:hypothetical protein